MIKSQKKYWNNNSKIMNLTAPPDLQGEKKQNN